MSYKPYKTVSDPLSGEALAEITYQETALGGKRFTFALKRDYIVSDGTKRTNFFLKRHIELLQSLLDKVGKELEAAEAEAREDQRKHLESERE